MDQRHPDPAFPQPLLKSGDRVNSPHQWGWGGMTRRAYFAAHAPHDIPAWFEPYIRPAPQPPDVDVLFPFLSDQDRRLLHEWRAGELVFPLPRHLALYEEAYGEYTEDLERWRLERNRAHTAQWPWAWADLVLNAEDTQCQSTD